MTDDLEKFTAERFEQGLRESEAMRKSVVERGLIPGLTRDEADCGFAQLVRCHEIRLAFFNDTVRPYLSSPGPSGMIAQQQLRLLAAEFEHHSDYRPAWAPNA